MDDPTTRAFLSPDATWVGVMLFLVAGLFLAALTIGLISRSIAPEAYDDTGPSDEPE